MEKEIEEKKDTIFDLQNREKSNLEKILIDVKMLQTEKENLLQEKQLLESEFKQTDTAFNEEVSLRLKFEYRINEIHTSHRELMVKQ